MICPTCGGQLPTVVLEAVGAFLAVPFVVFLAVVFALRRRLGAAADERPPVERP